MHVQLFFWLHLLGGDQYETKQWFAINVCKWKWRERYDWVLRMLKSFFNWKKLGYLRNRHCQCNTFISVIINKNQNNEDKKKDILKERKKNHNLPNFFKGPYELNIV